VKPTLTATGTVSRAIATAGILSILVGCLIAWLVFSAHIPAHLPYAGLAPVVALLVVYSAVAAARLGHNESSIVKLLAATLGGLALALVVGAALIQIIGCRYDACINL
jgi:hypothetical protein